MFTDDEAVLEVHHMVIAGFIVYGLLAESIRQLAEQPELRTGCRREVQENALVGPLTLETLSKLQTCTNVVLEAKRYVPLVPFAFGRAKREFSCSGFQIPAGWMTYLALSLNNKDRSIYKDPDRFDPDRFSPERASIANTPWRSFLKAQSHRAGIGVWDWIIPPSWVWPLWRFCYETMIGSCRRRTSHTTGRHCHLSPATLYEFDCVRENNLVTFPLLFPALLLLVTSLLAVF